VASARSSAARGAGNATVEQHDAPAAEIHEVREHEGLARELAPHRLGLIVIAGQAQHREPQPSKHLAEVCIAARVILHDVARHQQRIRWPIPRARMRERSPDRGQRRHTAQRLAFAAVQMRISELNEAQHAHSCRVAEPCRARQ